MNLGAVLEKAGIRSIVDSLLGSGSNNIHPLCQVLADVDDNGALIQAVVLYIGTDAIAAAGSKGPTFNKHSFHTMLLVGLARDLPPHARYLLVNALVNQLRYPNSHTRYFSYALLDMFGAPTTDSVAQQVQEQIGRVLLERLMVLRPHPWGLLITFLELYKNKSYEFYQLPFVRNHEEAWSLPNVQGLRSNDIYA